MNLCEQKQFDHFLRATWQAVSKMYNEEASKYGASMATGLALLSIDTEEGVPSTSLGPRMGMESTSLSRTLKTMENQGLIRREPNPDDGRRCLIKLTKEGLEKRSLSKEVVIQFNQSIEEAVSEEDLESFYKVIELILKSTRQIHFYPPKTSIMSTRRISKVAVIGSGIMGSGIACHFANIGVEVLLLDIAPNELNENEK